MVGKHRPTGLPVVAHVDAKAAAEGPSCQAYGQPGPAEGEPAALLVSGTAQGEYKGFIVVRGQTKKAACCQQHPAQSSTAIFAQASLLYLHANMSQFAFTRP